MTGIHIPGIYEPTLTAILRKAYLLAEIMTSKLKLKKKINIEQQANRRVKKSPLS